jgi:signal transduction histidine kinase
MRVSTRIISGFIILMTLGLVALAYQVLSIHRMQDINADLSAINFRAAAVILRLDHDAEAIHEFTEKRFTTGDPIYDSLLDQVVQEFDQEIADLQMTVGPNSPIVEVTRLVAAWNDYKSALVVQRVNIPPEPLETLPRDFELTIETVRARTGAAYDAVDRSIREQVSSAAEIGSQAEQLSYIVGATALLLGILLMFLLVRAISEPLRQLTRSTRIIAKGQFWHRLPTDGHDEFTELARDFNAMSERLGELDQMKKDFVSHVSHELKAPLASIRQTCLLLLEGIPGPLNDQQRRLLRF